MICLHLAQGGGMRGMEFVLAEATSPGVAVTCVAKALRAAGISQNEMI